MEVVCRRGSHFSDKPGWMKMTSRNGYALLQLKWGTVNAFTAPGYTLLLKQL